MVIGKAITALSGGGLKPTVVVTAPTGSTVTLDSVEGTEVSGTWTFTTTIGTHTVVATDSTATKSKTVSVNVSEVAIYSVKVVFELYLYNEGDECTSVSGGWEIKKESNHPSSYDTFTKNSDNLYFQNTKSSDSGIYAGIGTISTIDAGDYSTLYIDAQIISAPNVISVFQGFRYDWGTSPCTQIGTISAGAKARQTYNFTLNDLDRIIMFGSFNYSLRVYKVWLE